MTLVSVEMSYKTASAAALEAVSLDVPATRAAAADLAGSREIDEAAVVTTCNRTEAYVSTTGANEPAVAAIVTLLTKRAGMSTEELLRSVRVRGERESVQHLMSVACGLESMALGEEQIVAQLRRALDVAKDAGAVGPVLGCLFGAALRTSKRARAQTRIGTAGASLVRGGLDAAARHLGPLADRTALVIGAGSVGNLAGRLLARAGARLLVSSRTWDKAARLAEAVGTGEPVPPGGLAVALERADLIVSATAARDVVLTAADLMTSQARRGDAPVFVLDLAMPRDVDPRCARLPGVELVDLYGLGERLARGRGVADIDAVRRIIAEEAAGVLVRFGQRTAEPLILALRQRVRADAEAELHRLFRRTPTFTQAQREATEAALYRLVGKFLHGPTTRTKELSGTANGPACLDVIQRVFDLHLEEVGA